MAALSGLKPSEMAWAVADDPWRRLRRAPCAPPADGAPPLPGRFRTGADHGVRGRVYTRIVSFCAASLRAIVALPPSGDATSRSDMGRRRRSRRRERWQSTMKRVLLGAALFMLGSPNEAAAEPVVPAVERLELEWWAPEECPTRTHVLGEIARMAPPRIGRDVHARIAVGRGASGDYHAEVSLRVGSAFDQRDVQGATCAEIADASALLIALALAPPAVEAPPPPPPATKARPLTPGSTAHHLELHVGVGIGLDALSLPRPVPTVRPALGIAAGDVLLEIGGFVSPSVGKSLTAEPNKGASFRLLGAKLAGCWTFQARQFRAGPCAGVGLMGIGTEAFGVRRRRDEITWTPYVTGEARLFWKPLPRFEALVSVASGVLAEELDFSIESTSGARRLHRVDDFTLTIGIGVARLWDLF